MTAQILPGRKLHPRSLPYGNPTVGGVEPKTTLPATGMQDFYGRLPTNWVAVTHFRPGHGDEPDMYAGPLLSETEKQITVEVYGDPCTFWKQDCIIDHPKETTK